MRTDVRSSANVTNSSSPDRVDPSKLKSIPRGDNLQPAPIDGSVSGAPLVCPKSCCLQSLQVDKWFFISGAAV